MTGLLRTSLWIAAAAVAALAIPAVIGGDPYLNYMVQMIAIYMLAATGLNIAIGFAGQFQMAQGAVMATAAYGIAVLNLDAGWPLPAAAAASFAMALALGAFVALFSARLSSHYLLLATFGVQVIAIGLIRELPQHTGGVNGRPAIMMFEAFGIGFMGSTAPYSILLVVLAMLGLLLCDWLKRSYLGLGMQAARQNERMSNASGLWANRFKFLAVLVSTMYAAVAGLLVGPVHTYLVPETFAIEITLLLLVMVVVGGAGSVVGVAVATVILAVASQVAQSATTAWPLIYGLFVMAVLTVTSKGIAGLRDVFAPLMALAPHARGQSEPVPRAEPVPAAAMAPAARPAAAPAAAETALSVHEIRRSFGGVVALDGVSVDVAAGAVHGLVGPNGSGKTTLFEVVSGFVRQDEGKVVAFGRDISTLRPAERARVGIGRSFQHPTVLRESTVLENALVGAMPVIPGLRRLGTIGGDAASAEWHERAREALELVGLWEHRNEPAGRLSYGQRKLLDLARVVAARPSIVLLDEPIAGVDAASALFVREVIGFLRARRSTVVLVEHNMRFVMGLCDRVTVLNIGRVLRTGSPQEVSSDEAVIRSYLGERRTSRRDWQRRPAEAAAEQPEPAARMLTMPLPTGT